MSQSSMLTTTSRGLPYTEIGRCTRYIFRNKDKQLEEIREREREEREREKRERERSQSKIRMTKRKRKRDWPQTEREEEEIRKIKERI